MAGRQISAVFGERHDFKPDQIIRLQPRQASIHLFDAASGRHL